MDVIAEKMTGCFSILQVSGSARIVSVMLRLLWYVWNTHLVFKKSCIEYPVRKAARCLEQGIRPLSYLYLKKNVYWRIWSKRVISVIFQNEHRMTTLHLLLTIYSGSILWSWKWTKLAKSLLSTQKQEKTREAPIPTEGKMAQTLERTVAHRGLKISFLFGLYYHVKIGTHN